MALILPYDLGSVETGGPVQDLQWPLSYADLQKCDHRLLNAVSAMLDESPPHYHRLLLLAIPSVQQAMLTLGAVWLTSVGAKRQGIRFITSQPTIYEAIVDGRFDAVHFQYAETISRMARSRKKSWKTPLRRIAHFLNNNRKIGHRSGRTTILNHNHLLRAEAVTQTDRWFFTETPDRIFARPPSLGGAPASHHRELATAIGTHFARIMQQTDPDAAVPTPLLNHFARATAQWLKDLDEMARCVDGRRFPGDLWTGTSRNLTSRLVQSAVKDMGRRIVAFDHGGTTPTAADLTNFALGELAFASEFVTETEAGAGVLRDGTTGIGAFGPPQPNLRPRRAMRGTFDWFARSTPGSRVKRTVMYVTTAYVGESQRSWQPVLPAPVYADWQARLSDQLSDAGYHVLIKGHPEGILRGAPFVMSPRAAFVPGHFETVLDAADVFLFDYPATTTLWSALCTDKPVVFIDLQIRQWHPELIRLFDARCAIVKAHFDGNNLPVVDRDALARAMEQPRGNDVFAERYLVGYPRPGSEGHRVSRDA